MTLSDPSMAESQDAMSRQFERLLNSAIKMSPNNLPALVNLQMFKWKQGKIRDDEFVSFVTTELANKDQQVAILLFMLFKKHVLGLEPSTAEQKHCASVFSSKESVSNLARHLMNHPDFASLI